MGKRSIDVKKFLADVRCLNYSELKTKYELSEEKLTAIFSKLNRPDLIALMHLWQNGKLTESQFTRAFCELEQDLKVE
jgi:hypothetical protein